MNNFRKQIIKILTSRLFAMSLIFASLFSIITVKLFELQIVQGEEHQRKLKTSILQELSIKAPRGIILDRYGKPLAVNKVAFTVKIDDSIKINDRNAMLLELIHLLEENGDSFIDELPISVSKPYAFLFGNSEKRELRWKKDSNIKEELLDMNASETFYHLRERFKIDPSLPDEQARKVVSLRHKLYQQRYRKYQPITIAVDVTNRTVAVLEERHENFPGVFIDVEALRSYPEGKLFAHILGYIRGINKEEYEQYKQYGYSPDDIIGKIGIEKEKEFDLNGKDGQMFVEVDVWGRRINTIEKQQPQPGKKVFLTIDQKLQQSTEDALINTLKDILLTRLEASEKPRISDKEKIITLKQVLNGLVSTNTISFDKMKAASPDEVQYSVWQRIKSYIPASDSTGQEDIVAIKQALTDQIQNGVISSKEIVLILIEQGILTVDTELINRIQMGKISPIDVIKSKIKSGEISPQKAGLDPSTGAVVVVDVNTGEILSMVSYPSYDNNQLVNDFNSSYYESILTDPTSPLLNRVITQRKAPGSTFKMITALAGLEEGVISLNEYIYDKGIYTDAGTPPARCWIYSHNRGSHGPTNVVRAIEVSCNYFFYETAFRLGNRHTNTTVKGIERLNKYTSAFGLDSFSGIELGEYKPLLSSPENKERIKLTINPDATKSETRWYDGDTIRTAIGQSFNNYAPIHLAKYIATLANGGTLYKLHLIGKVEDPMTNSIQKDEIVIENQLQIKPENLEAIHKGMLAVTSGREGSARGVFQDFPIQIGGKTGTAQEGRRDPHAWFVAFAPYENPEIAVVVMIPYGDSSSYSAQVAKDVISAYLGIDTKYEKASLDNQLTP